MRTESAEDYDIPPIRLHGDRLIEYKKLRSKYVKQSEREIKPSSCCLCSKLQTGFCDSHSLPQMCLKSIAVSGEVLTTAFIIGTNLVDGRLGVKRAGTFKLICRKCDSTVFQGYENSSNYNVESSQVLMGQIALKICLFEKHKALRQKAMYVATAKDYSYGRHALISSVREMEAHDDDRNMKFALRAAKGGCRPYKLVYFKRLEYVTPLAFQVMVNPIVDLAGAPINNLFEPDASYEIEPLYACVMPMAGERVS